MAPDRGYRDDADGDVHDTISSSNRSSISHASYPENTSERGPVIHGRSFTFRGVAVGLLVGLVICFSNMYFGLQTGWVSTMTMPASLMGFGIFKALSRHLRFPFSPVENVLVQTVAGSMAIMPLGCGFVGVVCSPCPWHCYFSPQLDAVNQTRLMADMSLFLVQIPAMNYLLAPEEQGPLNIPLWKLITWSLGLCYFGVVFAVPL